MASIEDAHAALLRDRQLQFDFHAATQKPPAPEPWHWSLGADGVGLVWVLASAVALVVLVLVVNHLRRRGLPPLPARTTDRSPEEGADIPLHVARLALGDADALAGRGRFLEAARVLLSCGIDEIARRYPAMLRPAHTSRDIAALADLPDQLRRAFGRIAAAVEIGVFGGGAIGASDYAECREAFVTSALAGRA